MAKPKVIDIDRAVELYNKYGSIRRAALSLDCSPTTLKKVFIENDVELKKYKPQWNSIKYSEKCVN